MTACSRLSNTHLLSEEMNKCVGETALYWTGLTSGGGHRPDQTPDSAGAPGEGSVSHRCAGG